MKYYRLNYSYQNELNQFIENYKDEFDQSPDKNLIEAKKYVLNRYAWYQPGVIYAENETLNGNAIRVNDIIGMYPDDWEEVPMMFKLESKAQINKHCKDGKDRSFMIYFLNDVKILQQKLPFNENFEEGFNCKTDISDEYILNGKMYQTRFDTVTEKERHVSFPLSKIKLKELGVPNNFKIVCNSDFM